MHRLVTVGIRLDLFPAVAHLGHDLQTGGTVACVTLDGALVTTGVDFLTSILAGRHWSLTLNWWIYLRFTAWAKQGLSRDPPARLAETEMTKLSTYVFTT